MSANQFMALLLAIVNIFAIQFMVDPGQIWLKRLAMIAWAGSAVVALLDSVLMTAALQMAGMFAFGFAYTAGKGPDSNKPPKR